MIDDHPLVRLGVREVLADDFEVHETSSREEALELVRDIGHARHVGYQQLIHQMISPLLLAVPVPLLAHHLILFAREASAGRRVASHYSFKPSEELVPAE